MAISWVLRGFFLVIVTVTLLTLPMFLTLPFDEALCRFQCAVVITGWLWLMAAPVTLGVIYILRYIGQVYRKPVRATVRYQMWQ